MPKNPKLLENPNLVYLVHVLDNRNRLESRQIERYSCCAQFLKIEKAWFRNNMNHFMLRYHILLFLLWLESKRY